MGGGLAAHLKAEIVCDLPDRLLAASFTAQPTHRGGAR
jgi:hypothetical protein